MLTYLFIWTGQWWESLTWNRDQVHTLLFVWSHILRSFVKTSNFDDGQFHWMADSNWTDLLFKWLVYGPSGLEWLMHAITCSKCLKSARGSLYFLFWSFSMGGQSPKSKCSYINEVNLLFLSHWATATFKKLSRGCVLREFTACLPGLEKKNKGLLGFKCASCPNLLSILRQLLKGCEDYRWG